MHNQSFWPYMVIRVLDDFSMFLERGEPAGVSNYISFSFVWCVILINHLLGLVHDWFERPIPLLVQHHWQWLYFDNKGSYSDYNFIYGDAVEKKARTKFVFILT